MNISAPFAKLCLIFVSIIVFVSYSNAQQNVGIGTVTPDSSSILDLTATDKGFLVPRLTLDDATTASPVSNPAIGLLIYNIDGTEPHGFWYWNDSIWVQVGSGGGSGGCGTLDDSYNCGGSGTGRTITADYGPVEINLTNTTNGLEALFATSSTGTSGTPTAAVNALNSEQGVAVYGEVTNTGNDFSAIMGISNSSNAIPTTFPSGVSGYFDGSGIGVGVWGESSGSGGASGSGIYGKGNSNNFGGWVYSDNYPGLMCETNSSAGASAQIVSMGSSFINPSILARGWSQFDCSNSACPSIVINNLAGEPTIAPALNQYGYLGTNSYSWYYLYYANAIQTSTRETKRNITYLDEATYNFVIEDIDAINPAFYKYKIETDVIEKDNESKYRPNMHFGMILEDTPDYLQDNAFSGIDIYALSTLSLAGVKYNRNEIKDLQTKVSRFEETHTKTISDFGIIKTDGNEIHVNYSHDFAAQLGSDNIPVITVTPNSPKVSLYVAEQDDEGFIVVASGENEFSFNWIAMAKVKVENNNEAGATLESIPSELLEQLKVPNDKKMIAKELFDKTNQNKLIELKETKKDHTITSKKY